MHGKTKKWEKFEERLETFCKKSGFSDVEHNYRLSASDNRYQIDVICGAESNVVLIECKTVYKDSSFPESSDNIKTFTELLNGRREEYN